jgi:hypothetical protein
MSHLKKKKIFPAVYETRKFITVLTTARHLPPSSARLIQSKLLQCILPHSSKSHKSFLPSNFPNKIVYVFLFFSTRATCPARLVRLDLTARILFVAEHKSCGSSTYQLLQPAVTTNVLQLRSNHLPQHPVQQHPHKCVRPPSARTHTHTHSSVRPDFCAFDNKRDC